MTSHFDCENAIEMACAVVRRKAMKVAIYCRLSEEDKNKRFDTDDSNSIQNQKAMLLQYTMEQGWELYNIYSDDDYAGADRNRPEFQRLLRDAEDRKFDIVLCKTQSRFTRELELVEKYIHGLFPLWGIRFISIVDNADTANKGNKKSRQINGLVNEWYLEDMSENIRSVLTSRRMNGFHIGSFALYGYRKDPQQKGHLLIDEEAAAVVREVFTLFAQGYGKTAIARQLNERGIPNPTEYKRLHGLRYQQPKGKTGTLWKYFNISQMLANEMYIGNMVQGKYGSVSYKTKQNKPRPPSQWYRVEGTHEAIIDRELWDRVQSLRAQRAKPLAGGTLGVFAGKARCANCGYGMRSRKSRGKYYLECPSRHVAKEACEGAFLSVEKLEGVVLEEANRIAAAYVDKEAAARGIRCESGLDARRKRLQGDLAVSRRKAEEYAKGLRSLYLDKVKGLLTDQDYWELSQDFTAERRRWEALAEQGQKQLAELEARRGAAEDPRALVEKYTRLEHLTHEMVEILIDHITIGKRKPGEALPPIEIHWRF